MNHGFTVREHVERTAIRALIVAGHGLKDLSEACGRAAQHLTDVQNARFIERLMTNRHDPVVTAVSREGELVEVSFETGGVVESVYWRHGGKSEPLSWLGEAYEKWAATDCSLGHADYSPDSVKIGFGYTGDPTDERTSRG